MNFTKQVLLAFMFCIVALTSKAQFTTTWAFTANASGVKAGANAADIAIADATYGSVFTSNIGYSSNGVKCQPTSGTNWPTTPTDGWHIDFPISPVGSIDATLVGLNFAARTSGSSGDNVVSLAVQKDGAGAFTPFGTPQNVASGGSSTVTFPAFNKKLYTGHTYIIRMYLYAASGSTSASRSLTIKTNVFNGTISPAGTQPSVTTSTVTATGKYTATTTGTLTAGTYIVVSSGVVWGSAANPTVALTTKTTNGPTTTGAINLANGGAITGLSAGTLYHTRAYAESETGDVFYGAELTFTTNPATVPIVTTNAITNITSVKANSGGAITDSGGMTVTEKGVCWSSSPNPTIANAITMDGNGIAAYASLLKILNPNTNYCVRAYAKNSVGIGYGNEVCFTTLAPQPVIITTTVNGQNSIPFGNITVNTSSAIKTYTLSANNLTPASGSITINAPTDFLISSNVGSGFASSITINYTGGTIAPTTIYVKFVPTKFGSYSGLITHTGGGATATNIDDVTVTGTGIQNPSELSNTGTDFWVGYGFQSLMTGSNNQEMVMYISSKQDAVVTVEIGKPGDANYYNQTYNVVANVALSTFAIPKIGAQDARLNSTGILPRGIHVYSNGVPFALWAHVYASQSSGATMVLPTNTWGSKYSVLTVGGSTNTGVPHSFFFVQAAEDNTIVDIVPSDDITATVSGTSVMYPANIPFSVTLNKGDVFNALGKLISSNTGNDLTGTTISSRDCSKKIALFTGNGRVLLGTNICVPNEGSDNFLQQMFPRQAWGTKYITSPFRDMENGFYKVIVNDPTTVVTVNGTAITGLVQNAYTIYTDTLLKIESDKPVMVAQFLVSHKCGQGTNTPGTAFGKNGDPEMVILSPVQQAIEEATFYSTNNFSVNRNLVNVVIPNNGVSSFTLDGVNMASEFKIHTADANYSYAVFDNLLGNASHNLKSNIPFTAIAYGWKNDNHESYGYNAGTHLRPLDQFISVQNPYPNISGDSVVPACLNNDFKYSVILPYKPNTMHWDFFNNPIQVPNSNAVTVNNPLPKDSFLYNGIQMYKYELPTTYTFSGTGSFPVNLTMNATNADGCTGTQTITFTLKVLAPPTPYFLMDTSAICGSSIVNFTDSSYDKNGYGMNGREWHLPGFSPPLYTDSSFAVAVPSGNFTFTLRAINSIGCYRDTSFNVIAFAAPVIDSITLNKPATCTNSEIKITAHSTTIGGAVAKYYWDFGDGKKDSSITNTFNYKYTTANTSGYTVTVYAISVKGCIGFATTIKIPVYDFKAAYTVTSPSCVNVNVPFTNTSIGTNVASPLAVTWLYNFGDGSNSTGSSPNYIYTVAGTYATKQVIKLYSAGTEICADSSTNPVVITPVLVLSNVIVTNGYGCVGKNITFTAIGTTAPGTIKWYWTSSDGRKDTTTTNSLTRSFASTGTYGISVFAKINDGCASNTMQPMVQIFNPKADLSFVSPQCINTSVSFNDASTGTVTSAIIDTKYTWSFGDGGSSSAKDTNYTYTTAGNYMVKIRTSLVVGSLEFCADSMSKPIVINAKLAKPIVTIDASKTTTTSLTYNWNNIVNATSYNVSLDGGSFSTSTSGSLGLTHVANNLLPNSSHTLCVAPQGACKGDTACFTAKTIEPSQDLFIPNTFTPNGDGKNDKFVICANTIKSVKLIIFSQYGEKLHETISNSVINNCFELWDGRAFGKPQPTGVYAYIFTVNLNNGEVVNKKGLLNLIR